MKSSEFKECLDKVNPNEFQKQRMLDQALKPHPKRYKKLLFAVPVLLGMLVMGLMMPDPRQQLSENSAQDELSNILYDQVISFEWKGDVYISTGEYISDALVGSYKGEIEISDVSELRGCSIYESSLENHMIVERNGTYELFRRWSQDELDLACFGFIINRM